SRVLFSIPFVTFVLLLNICRRKRGFSRGFLCYFIRQAKGKRAAANARTASLRHGAESHAQLGMLRLKAAFSRIAREVGTPWEPDRRGSSHRHAAFSIHCTKNFQIPLDNFMKR
ncbi:MAG: hypothetical protein ACI4ME_09725, partial [Aristaeellaceae bacterium]